VSRFLSGVALPIRSVGDIVGKAVHYLLNFIILMSPKNCPHCGIVSSHFIKWGKTPQKRIRYRYSDYHKTFTNRTGTIRHRTQLNDKQWNDLSRMASLRTCPSGSDIGRFFQKHIYTGQRYLRRLKSFIPPSSTGPPLSGTAEFDESVMQRQWVVGGISRKNGKVKLCIVQNRSAHTLTSLIRHTTHYNTVILTDEWKGYHLIKYERPAHYTVNHSQSFVNPYFSKIHTNRIEGL